MPCYTLCSCYGKGKVLEWDLNGCSCPSWHCPGCNKSVKLSRWAGGQEHLLIPGFPSSLWQARKTVRPHCLGAAGSLPQLFSTLSQVHHWVKDWGSGQSCPSSPCEPKSEPQGLPPELLDFFLSNQPCPPWPFSLQDLTQARSHSSHLSPCFSQPAVLHTIGSFFQASCPFPTTPDSLSSQASGFVHQLPGTASLLSTLDFTSIRCHLVSTAVEEGL